MTNTSEKIVFHVSLRKKQGSGNASRLRKEGKIPCNVYGLKEKSISITTDSQGLKKLYSSQGDTGLIYLQIGDNKKQVPVLIDELQTSVIGGKILHASFKRVSLSVKIEAEIPVTMVGEAKIDEAIVSLIKDSVLVEALPADFPENFEIDVSALTEVGQSISLEDLVFDKSKVSLVLGEEEKASEIILVNVQVVKEEVIVEEVEAETEGDETESEEGGEKSGDKDEEAKKEDDSSGASEMSSSDKK